MAGSTSNIEHPTPVDLIFKRSSGNTGTIIMQVLNAVMLNCFELIVGTGGTILLHTLTNTVLLPLAVVGKADGSAYNNSYPARIFWGVASVTVSGGSGSTVVNISAMQSASSYSVTVAPQELVSAAIYLGVQNTSASSFTITVVGVNQTHTVAWQLIGY
jgi:hypothetical protein